MREKRVDECVRFSLDGMWPASEYFNVPVGLLKRILQNLL